MEFNRFGKIRSANASAADPLAACGIAQEASALQARGLILANSKKGDIKITGKRILIRKEEVPHEEV